MIQSTYKNAFHIRIFTLLVMLLPLLAAQPAAAQVAEQQTTNGWHISPKGKLHIMVIFAEMKFDSSYAKLDPVKDPIGTKGWKVGRMPHWREHIVAPEADGKAWMTKYFREASFGNFEVTGDFLDTIITVPISEIRNNAGQVVTQEPFANNFYKRKVLEKVNTLHNPKFRWGSTMEDFDRWTFKGVGRENENVGNGKIDLVMLIWRNIHVHNLGNMSGFVSPGNIGEILGMGTDTYSMFRAQSQSPKVIMRHEFSHMLYGGNNFHTANGGVGTRTFLPTVGGYSNMSASDALSGTWNGWDRERLGWKHPDNDFVNQTHCEDGASRDGSLVYGEELCGEGVYVLRDFVTSGDVIKIKLPHLPGKVRNQYLWLENHQRRKGYIDHDKILPKGLYSYIQVGRDQREGRQCFGGPNNYLWPVVAHGQYDFGYDPADRHPEPRKRTRQSAEWPSLPHAPPLRQKRRRQAHHHLGRTSEIRIRLAQGPQGRRELMPNSYFSYVTFPVFGTHDVPFNADTHPKSASATILRPHPCCPTAGRRKMADDNRRIYLNGLSVEVLRTDAEGNMYLKIRWDDFDIIEPVRWCGDIVLKEELNVQNSGSITLDQGYSPQVPLAVQTIDEQVIFAEPTVMELDSGSVLRINSGSQLRVTNGATLLIRKGASVEIQENASIEVEAGAFIRIEEGSDVDLARRRASINIAEGAKEGLNPYWGERFTAK